MKRATLAVDGGYRTELRVRGDGAPLVAIHGTPLDAATWEPLVLPGRRLVAYDLRGHGSAADSAPGTSYEQLAADLLAVLDHLALDRVEVVGHSFGGQVAQAFAAAHPERVERLWIVCSRSAPFPPFAAIAERVEAEGFGELGPEFLARWFTAADLEAETDAVRYARRHLTDAHAAAFAAALRLIAPFTLPAALREAPVPISLIAGERDPVATPDALGEAAELCGGDFHLARGRGHMLPVEDPALLARLLLGA